MNGSRDRSCNGKVRHRTRAAARKALAGSIRETGDLGLVFYFCPHCHGFHVGHPGRREQTMLRVDRLTRLIDQAMAADARPSVTPSAPMAAGTTTPRTTS